jgi:hypothetical protein
VPAGYELVDESPGSGPQASQMYGVIYTDDGSMQHEIRIDTLIDPAQPAITRLTFPEAARVNTIGRWTGYAAAGSLTIDITPGYQVMISLGIGPNAGPTNDERLLQLARALVSVDDAARGALMTQAALHPLMAGTYDACDPTTQSGCPITPSTQSTIDGS